MSKGVSIIIPVYNTEKLIGTCIESAINQSYQNLEILIINDGSTDNTSKICHEWENIDSRIKVYDNPRYGLGKTRNWAIEHSTKEYVTFLDADDYIHTRYVEELVNSIIRNQSDIAICDINYIDRATGNVMKTRIRFPKECVCVTEDYSVINKSRLFAWGKLYKKTLFENEHLYPEWTFEDVALTPLLIYKAKVISRVPHALYNYYIGQTNTLSVDPKNIKDLGKSLSLLWDRMDKFGNKVLMNNEMKKIAVGELRFAKKRWESTTNKESIVCALSKLEEVVGTYYPSLIGVFDKSFAIEDQLIKDAIRFVIVNMEQVVPIETELADYYFFFESEEMEVDGDKIVIPNKYKSIQDEEIRCWEIAEYIMTSL